MSTTESRTLRVGCLRADDVERVGIGRVLDQVQNVGHGD